mgnify:CR=1 FL=1
MALSRRRSSDSFSASIWPGFVDAMTALLLVLMFVLSIFMIVQFMLRETITGIEDTLAASGFVRVHRSAIVNIDRVAEIVPFETGDGEARLRSNVRVPVSRRYRKILRDQLV